MMRFVIVCSLIMLASTGCQNAGDSGGDAAGTAASTEASRSTQIALNWYPEMEHGGYLAAKTLGLYSAEGVEVEIIPGGPGAPQFVIAELAAGRIQFAVSDADNVVKARAAGARLVALMAPLQTSPRCIMVHQAAGFQSLQDLSNVDLAISDSRPFALWMKKKLPLTGVNFVPYSGQVGEFLLNPKFAQQAYVFSEPFVAKEKGGDPQTLMVSAIGFDPYASLLVTTENVIRDKPELVQSVVRASLEGWKAYLKDSRPVNAYIQTLNKELTEDALNFGATAVAPLCQPMEGQEFCGMSIERWKALVSQIEELNDIPAGSVNPEECFNDIFLQAVSAAAK